MLLVETEGSYTNQIILETLDVHVGQSYSVLVTADQNDADYYIVAAPKPVDNTVYESLVGVGVLHFPNLIQNLAGPGQRDLTHLIWTFHWIKLDPLGSHEDFHLTILTFNTDPTYGISPILKSNNRTY